MTYSSLNLSLLLPGKPVPIKPVGLPVSVRVGHFKARPDPEARSLEVALPVQGSWRVGLGSGSGFGSGLTSLETDEQTKIVNVIMKQYLRMYCSYLQDDWEKWLSLMKFTANNMMNESTGVTLFYATYGQDPRIGFEPWTEIDEHGPMIKWLQQINAKNFADQRNKMTNLLQSEIL